MTHLTSWTLPDVHLFLVVDGVAVRDVELQHVNHVLWVVEISLGNA